MRGKGFALALLLFFGLSHNSSASSALRVLQLNTWQLRIFGIDPTVDRVERLKILPEMIAETGADVIALEEVWKTKDKNTVVREMRKRGYPYSNFTTRRFILGDGLVVVSKFPIIAAENSPVYRPATTFEESFAHKRAKHLVLLVPELGAVDFFMTHVGATAFDVNKDEYYPTQKKNQDLQLKQFSDWIKGHRSSKFIIISGDLNSHYQEYDSHGQFFGRYSIGYQNLIKGTCQDGSDLVNTYLVANGKTVTDPADATYSQDNPYAAGGLFGGTPNEDEDYIFTCANESLKIASSEIIFKDSIPQSYQDKYHLDKLPLRISDHYGVFTTFKVQ